MEDPGVGAAGAERGLGLGLEDRDGRSAGDERVRHGGPDDPRADHRHVGVDRA